MVGRRWGGGGVHLPFKNGTQTNLERYWHTPDKLSYFLTDLNTGLDRNSFQMHVHIRYVCDKIMLMLTSTMYFKTA